MLDDNTSYKDLSEVAINWFDIPYNHFRLAGRVDKIRTQIR